MLVVQLREAADEPSLVYGVPSLGPSGREVVEEDRKDCKWQHPRAPSARRLWAEGATEAVFRIPVGHEGGLQGVAWEGQGGGG